MNRMKQYKMETSIPFSLWRLGTLSDQSEEKFEKSQEIDRDAAIVVTMHMWACLEVSDEFIAIGVRMNMCRDP